MYNGEMMRELDVVVSVAVNADDVFQELSPAGRRKVVLDHFDCAELMDLAEKEDKARFVELCKEVVEENE
jgi:hypothetical protein